eukprot:scaffold301_cov370-Pavlova_lutheri.AAC.1
MASHQTMFALARPEWTSPSASDHVKSTGPYVVAMLLPCHESRLSIFCRVLISPFPRPFLARSSSSSAIVGDCRWLHLHAQHSPVSSVLSSERGLNGERNSTNAFPLFVVPIGVLQAVDWNVSCLVLVSRSPQGPEEPVPVLVLHSRCGFQFLDGWVDPVSHWDPVEGRVGLDPPPLDAAAYTGGGPPASPFPVGSKVHHHPEIFRPWSKPGGGGEATEKWSPKGLNFGPPPSRCTFEQMHPTRST